MINILNNVKYQFKLFTKSKHIYLFVISAVAIVSIYSFGQFKQLETNINSYDQSLQLFMESGISEEEALSLEHKQQEIKSENGDTLTIDQNPLISAKIATTMTLYSISPYYFLQNILEGATYLFFPLLLTIYAIYIASQEYENKVIRVRALKNDWGKVMFSKILYVALISAIFIIFTSLLAYFISIIQYKFIDQDIISKFFTSEYKVSFNILTSIGISILVSVVFVSLSTMIVTLFKNRYLSLIVVLVYLLAIPSLGIIDLKNVLMNITFTYFPYYGSSSLASIKPVPITYCFLLCAIILFGSMAITYYGAKKQNKF
ncbi:hypothetical protein [Thomasclavelia sp.]